MSSNHTSISRRKAVQASAAIGAAASLGFGHVQGQDSTPVAADVTAPMVGTENQTRGQGGELKIIHWQAPTTLLRYRSTGVKDYLPCQLILEPLFSVLLDGSLYPTLAADVPSKEAGTLADDLTWATVSLKKDVLWSDGTPFTAKDVRFTWEWNINPDSASLSIESFTSVTDVEIIDDHTVTFRYANPNPIWFEAMTGSGATVILPEHVLGEMSTEKNDAFGISPIGTGPFVVDAFTPNDQATFLANENYREANKPYFSSVLIKGGGDAAAAARAVMQTADFDFAWNIQVEPDVVQPLMTDESPGVLDVTANFSLEAIYINHSDPRAEVDGEISQKDTPHPILSDQKVRQALALAIPRQQISERLFLVGNPAAANVIVGNVELESPNNTATFDLEAAGALLDEAGWTMDGDVRKKDGKELSLVFATTVNSVRQKSQALVKAALAQIGVNVELEQVDAGLFFDSSAGNDQGIARFPWDLAQYATTITSTRPIRYMDNYYGGVDGANIAQKSNVWSAGNRIRWQNDEYDAALDSARNETDDAKLVESLIQANDIAVQEVAVIPLIQNGQNCAYNRRLNSENFGFNPFEYHYWNIANWNEVEA